MAVVHATCGHEITGEITGVWWKREEGWCYGVLCSDCYISYGAQADEPTELVSVDFTEESVDFQRRGRN